MPECQLIHGDCLDILPTLEADSIDSVVTDPPYFLEFMKLDFDTLNAQRFTSLQDWYQQHFSAVFRVLKPGGYLASFGGTRTFHRLACGLEDAGFEMRDCLTELFDSDRRLQNFRASLNPEQQGAFEELLASSPLRLWVQWQGFPKGQGNLKPAFEPILVVRKPGPRVLPLGIDECRVPLHGDYKSNANGRPSLTGLGDHYDPEKANQPSNVGRYPANLVHDGSEEVMDEFAAFGERVGATSNSGGVNFRGGSRKDKETVVGYCDTGAAARFFYCAKVSRSERGEGNNHPTLKPLAIMQWLCRLLCPVGALVLDPFMGSGTTGLACRATGRRFLGIERDAAYFAICERRIHGQLPQPDPEPPAAVVPATMQQGSLFDFVKDDTTP